MAPITFEHITKRFDETTAVADLSIEVADGEFLVLVGPSGCGKTTALRCVAGLEEITGGQIKIDARIVNRVPSKDRNIAMVFQSYAIWPHLDVFDNVAYGLRVRPRRARPPIPSPGAARPGTGRPGRGSPPGRGR